MLISYLSPVATQYQNVTAGTPFRFTMAGPILYKTAANWATGQLFNLATGDAVPDEPSPTAACYVVDGAFYEQL